MVGIAMVHTIYKYMLLSDNKNAFVMSCMYIYTLYSTCVDPYSGKKAKLFEYATGLSPNVAI